jgi:hypothetical protein
VFAQARQPGTIVKPTAVPPLNVVMAQIEAFNQRDLEGFLATYDSGAELYDLASGRPLATSQATLRERYRDQFENDCQETIGRPCPDLHVNVISTQTVGNFVIAKESARLQIDTPPMEFVVVYEVIDAKIRRAWFIGK